MFPDNPAWGNIRATLTPEMARTIRSQYKSGVRSFTKLSELHNLGRITVRDVILNIRYPDPDYTPPDL